jgi:hypothetical protein
MKKLERYIHYTFKCLELGFPAHHAQSPKISETEAFLIMLKKLLGETVSI